MKSGKRFVIGIVLMSLTVFATGCATGKPSEQAGTEVTPAEVVTETSSTNETPKDAAAAPETAAPEAGSANEAPKE